MALVWIITSTFIVSIISLIGVVTLAIKDDLFKKLLFCLLGFSAGALLGSAFLHIIPEAVEANKGIVVYYYIILGIVAFFLMEKYFYWRHCHDENCSIHAFTYLNLIGEGVHNFIDGLAIAASFIVSVDLGLVTTLAIVLHEIPKELGNFGVLVYGGLTKQKALFYNFISALMAMLGALLGYFVFSSFQGFSNFILPVTAGGFIYIATSDLIPEMHKKSREARATPAFLAFLLGIALMALAKQFLPH
ncbi:MAG: ZIP family metal transporter [Candidatus Omnitrophica bacterium]|nr:ZIP family metal transporter [Candidatus Omnitrophota bacterium]